MLCVNSFSPRSAHWGVRTLHQRLAALLRLPAETTEGELLAAVQAALRERDLLAEKIVDLLVRQYEIEQQRTEALEILRQAAELHTEAKKKTGGT